MWNFLVVATSNLQKNVRTHFLLLLLLSYLFWTTKEPAAPTNASCKMDDPTDSVCVWVEKDKKRFSVGFSHPKAKLTTEPTVVSLA